MVFSSSSETCSESRPLFSDSFLTQETAHDLACSSVVGRAADGGVVLHGQFDGARFTELPSFEWLARKSRSTRVSVTPSAAVIASTVKTGQKGVCTSRADQAGAGQKQAANRGKERQAATSRSRGFHWAALQKSHWKLKFCVAAPPACRFEPSRQMLVQRRSGSESCGGDPHRFRPTNQASSLSLCF